MSAINKKTLIILLIGLVIATSVFFGQTILHENKSNSSAAKISDSIGATWLASPSCSPPCWEGIYPGQIAISALPLLKRNKNITNVQTFEYSETQRGEIRWDWIDNPGGGRVFYNGNSLEDGRIYAVIPSIECCLTLEQVVDAYGYPNFVAITKKAVYEMDTPQVNFTYALIWIDKGFRVSGFPLNAFMIDQDFQINQVAFFEPTLDGYHQLEAYSLQPWHGYDEASEYLAH